MLCVTSIHRTEMSIQIPLQMELPRFEWNLEDFSESGYEKFTITEL